LFFGQLKDMAGRSEDSLEMPEDTRVNDVFEHYASAFPAMRPLAGSIVVARNQQFTPGSEFVQEGDEIAFLPPVSGGSGAYTHEIEAEGGHFFGLTRDPIDTQSLRKRLLEGTDGAIVVFEGVVRNNTRGRATLYLDYECYESMAIRTMADIGMELTREHPIGRIAMVHRLGRMEIGEASVAVIATAPHRRPAFAAALEGINRLKKLVPIWKKEHFADGEVWVEGEWDSSVRQR
jgi:molybdopterin synthase catalytic subunit